MMVLSYAVGLVPFDPERVVALRGLERVVFKRPTRMGDTIRVEVKVAEKKPLDEGHGLVGFKWRILNQDGKVACVLRVDASVCEGVIIALAEGGYGARPFGRVVGAERVGDGFRAGLSDGLVRPHP